MRRDGEAQTGAGGSAPLVVQEFPFGSGMFPTRRRVAIAARFVPETVPGASRGKTATAVEGHPQRPGTRSGDNGDR